MADISLGLSSTQRTLSTRREKLYRATTRKRTKMRIQAEVSSGTTWQVETYQEIPSKPRLGIFNLDIAGPFSQAHV
jgi:hypothetical protein